ncbi:MAG: hypothetical protein ACFB21_13895 [Opitutales bacterium]
MLFQSLRLALSDFFAPAGFSVGLWGLLPVAAVLRLAPAVAVAFTFVATLGLSAISGPPSLLTAVIGGCLAAGLTLHRQRLFPAGHATLALWVSLTEALHWVTTYAISAVEQPLPWTRFWFDGLLNIPLAAILSLILLPLTAPPRDADPSLC